MPETNPSSRAVAEDVDTEHRIRELEAEIVRLQAEIDRRSDDELRTWIKAVRDAPAQAGPTGNARLCPVFLASYVPA